MPRDFTSIVVVISPCLLQPFSILLFDLLGFCFVLIAPVALHCVLEESFFDLVLVSLSASPARGIHLHASVGLWLQALQAQEMAATSPQDVPAFRFLFL